MERDLAINTTLAPEQKQSRYQITANSEHGIDKFLLIRAHQHFSLSFSKGMESKIRFNNSLCGSYVPLINLSYFC